MFKKPLSWKPYFTVISQPTQPWDNHHADIHIKSHKHIHVHNETFWAIQSIHGSQFRKNNNMICALPHIFGVLFTQHTKKSSQAKGTLMLQSTRQWRRSFPTVVGKISQNCCFSESWDLKTGALEIPKPCYAMQSQTHLFWRVKSLILRVNTIHKGLHCFHSYSLSKKTGYI